MKSIGIVRLVDELGRIVIPMELRRVMGINEGDPLEIFVDDEKNQLMLRQYNTGCLFCESMESLSYFRGRYVCQSCKREMELETLGRLESAVTLESVEKSSEKPSETPSEETGKRTRRKKEEVLRQLADVMRTYPQASQSEWARMIGVTPGYVSQLVRIINEEDQL
ncbi:transcriptional pleiotropic regulator of transition state genes [Paenibacillus rhizosphaerae]|uniref:Transcriptional pleiotropic regulator of transition state genes n=1 Tax=Paenibacillus rhizosphaerae TaxID=297318 RepID=A0A839TK98_9BACL|nr:AbrB/MazE/SpoVT family DNA-binding domain-containing protein [Paenibacillus rhizosphaerae]MBB3127072.1 transcriptional pleiotropic regulator of transition state genes [Paenibacillus rhizosphaerae]